MEAVEGKLNSGCPYFRVSIFRILMRFCVRFQVGIGIWSLPTNYDRHVSLLLSVIFRYSIPIQTRISCVADSESLFRQAVGILERTTGVSRDTDNCTRNTHVARGIRNCENKIQPFGSRPLRYPSNERSETFSCEISEVEDGLV